MKLLTTLTICTLATFSAILFLYWFIAPNPVLARVPFALLISVVPTLPVLIGMAAGRLSTKAVVTIYFVGFVCLLVLQAVLR